MTSVEQPELKAQETPVAHIYAFAIAWLLAIVFGGNTPNLQGLLIITIFSLAVSGGVWLICFIIRLIKRGIQYKKERIAIRRENALKAREEAGRSPVLNEGLALLKELESAKDKIANNQVFAQMNGIIQIASEILNKVERKPELEESIRRFLNYYLPTATKMVTDYGDMEKQSTKGENVLASMAKIEHGLSILRDAFETQLDTLFSHAAMDVATDVDVLENVLKKEGLIKSGQHWQATSVASSLDKENE